MSNENLNRAKKLKNDEFYTFYSDIENELKHYKEQLKNKIVYCNCDDYNRSQFVKYFIDNFNILGLKKLIATCYNKNSKGLYFESNGINVITSELKCDGDFKSKECVELLKECDIVITNPPFSLFRDFIDLIFYYNKDCLVVGSIYTVTYKNIFPLMMINRLRIGYNNLKNFFNDSNVCITGSYCYWYTTLDTKEKPFIKLTKQYNETDYKEILNYNAININRTKDIPCGYKGVMAVPISFIQYHNPNQFKIIGLAKRGGDKSLKTKIFTKEDNPKYDRLNSSAVIEENGKLKVLFPRILIKRVDI